MTAEIERIFDKIDSLKETINTHHIEIIQKISEKPCAVHEERIKSNGRSIKRLWTIDILITAAIVGAVLKLILT